MLNTYLTLIQTQRINNPTREKDYRTFPLAKRINTTSLEAIQDLARRPNSQFIGIIKRDIPLYSDVEDVYYYEFINLGIRSQSTFVDWQFWYIPVSKYTSLLSYTSPNILPSYKIYNVDTAKVTTVITKTQPLIPFNRPNTYFYNTPYNNNLHPLLSNFIFTGYSFLDKNGFMIYEYNDFKMFTDHISISYYSMLRPLNFFIPSSIANGYGLEVDINMLRLLNKPPNYLEIYTGLPDLRATNKSTTSSFSNIRKWYEYIRYIDGQPFNKILLPYMPTSLSIDFVNVQLNNSQMSILFKQGFNQQTLSINQFSSNNKISIQ